MRLVDARSGGCTLSVARLARHPRTGVDRLAESAMLRLCRGYYYRVEAGKSELRIDSPLGKCARRDLADEFFS